MRIAVTVALALLVAVGAAGCNQLFGLDAPAADDDGGGDDAAVDAAPDDRDGDGVANDIDNCPTVANPSQADEDGDAALNGGDACDLCPHRAAPAPGQPHANSDGDELGDDCDPDLLVRHCLRWFDGFADASDDVVRARYATSGGRWLVTDGALVQDDPDADAAEALIAGAAYTPAVVTTTARLETLPTTNLAYRNTVGVAAGRSGGGLCFASVSRDVTAGTPGVAKGVLSQRQQLSELVAAEAPFPPGTVALVAGERAGVSLDLLATPGAVRAIGSLYDRGVLNHVVSATLGCGDGAVGVRTGFARASFEYLLVVDVEGSDACGPRGP